MKTKLVIIISTILLLQGCSSEVACNSDSVIKIIVRDFSHDLSRKLPKEMQGFIDNISIDEFSIIEKQSKNVNLCEAKVIVTIKSTGLDFPYQKIKYKTQLIENSSKDDSVKVTYEYIDTFNYLAKEVYAKIQPVLLQRKARENGFNDVSAYKKYRKINNSIKHIKKKIIVFKNNILLSKQRIVKFATKVEKVKEGIESGKTVLLTNEYLEMEPVNVKKQTKKGGFSFNVSVKARG